MNIRPLGGRGHFFLANFTCSSKCSPFQYNHAAAIFTLTIDCMNHLNNQTKTMIKTDPGGRPTMPAASPDSPSLRSNTPYFMFSTRHTCWAGGRFLNQRSTCFENLFQIVVVAVALVAEGALYWIVTANKKFYNHQIFSSPFSCKRNSSFQDM